MTLVQVLGLGLTATKVCVCVCMHGVLEFCLQHYEWPGSQGGPENMGGQVVSLEKKEASWNQESVKSWSLAVNFRLQGDLMVYFNLPRTAPSNVAAQCMPPWRLKNLSSQREGPMSPAKLRL